MTSLATLDLDPVDVSTEPVPRPPHSRRSERLSVLVLLAGTAILYLWGLGASGYANDFYAAAVQVGTKSWTAFFFGSFDSSNFITVDKPPLSLWPMELSGRIFGFSSWSMLVPQALEGVAAVWLLHATVKRWHGHWAGILAGALLAVTPVAVLMFRFNNPDASMVLLMVAAAYCVTRAVESASPRWLFGTGAIMGLSFLAKGLQPFTLLPALAAVYLIAAPTTLRRRLLHLLGAGAALVAGAGWWVLAVLLTPAADRPYIGGSGDNSPLGLAFGYNGLSRLSGSGGGPGGGGPGASFSGAPGVGRLFNDLNGGQIAWLLPTALLALVALGALARRDGRLRAAAILWAGWLLVTAAVLSFAGGIIHTYYTVELAPAIAALVAIGTVVLWRLRAALVFRLVLAGGSVLTGACAFVLLRRTPDFAPWVAYVVLAASLVAAALVVLASTRRALAVLALAAGLVALAGGPAAYALDTAATPHTGSIPSAGPAVAGGGFGGGVGRGFGGGSGGREFGPPAGDGQGGSGGGPGGAPEGAFEGGGSVPGMAAPQGGGARVPGSAGRGQPGAGLGGATANSALTTLLRATTTRWAAAAVGSQAAAPLELASGKAVMAIGGFSGSDPAPTLAEFEKLVAAGEIRYFVASGGGFGGPGGGGGNAITQWVEQHFSSTTVGGTTVYDLTKPTTSGT